MIALWNVNENNTHGTGGDDESEIDTIMAWKGHSGRWVADAKFVELTGEDVSKRTSPRTLVTAGNDGTVCFWDLMNVSNSSGLPRLIDRTGKELHRSGIFCMDVKSRSDGSAIDSMVCTGSKDKTIAIFNVDSYTKHKREPLWTSSFHSAKVGAVALKGGNTSTILASASDDGLVAIHDYRMDGASRSGKGGVAAHVEAHRRPHSVTWDPNDDNILATAGLDPVIHLWDWRYLSKPLANFKGHVPVGVACKRIHRPVFVPCPWSKTHALKNTAIPKQRNKSFLLTGGQGSGSLSTYELKNTGTSAASNNSIETSLFSRGELPSGCGDAGCIAVQDRLVAVAVEHGEVLLLNPGV
ncbi:MAG: hypothetical protein SGARI_001646 [Bacillariaceae sp.]